MARGRMINNKISTSLQFNDLPDDTCRLLATWIISHLDKNGVFNGDAVIVKSYVFPRRTDVTIEQVADYLQAMSRAKDGDGQPLIVLFEARGETWQWWPQFRENQVGLRPERESTSFPQPPDAVPQDDGKLPEGCRKDDGETPAEEKGSKGKLSEGKGKTSGADAPSESDEPTPYQEIREQWITLFPDKPKPRATNKTLQGKAKTRFKDSVFRDKWRDALRRASRSDFCNDGGWFDLSWFLLNDDNWEKCLNGKYDGSNNNAPTLKEKETWGT